MKVIAHPYHVIRSVEVVTAIPIADMRLRSRKRELVDARRHLAAALDHYCGWTLARIAEALCLYTGERDPDHTVIHSYLARDKDFKENNPAYAAISREISSRINAVKTGPVPLKIPWEWFYRICPEPVQTLSGSRFFLVFCHGVGASGPTFATVLIVTEKSRYLNEEQVLSFLSEKRGLTQAGVYNVIELSEADARDWSGRNHEKEEG
jgi:hypothetical protein